MTHSHFTLGPVGLRAIEEADAAFLVQLRRDSWMELGYVEPISECDQDEWLKGLIGATNRRYYILTRTKDGASLGVIRITELDWINRSACVGGDVAKRFRGKGYGRAMFSLIRAWCFGVLNLHRLWLLVLETNKRALHVYQKAGFTREGVQRDAIWRDGRYVDYVSMSFVRSERCDRA